MRTYVLDANALISFLVGATTGNGQVVKRILQSGKAGTAEILMSSINLGEVYYVLRKTASEPDLRHSLAILNTTLSIQPASADVAIEAAELKFRYKLGYADSFAASLAMQRKATLVSADPAFEKLGKRLKLLKLARFKEA